MSAALIPVKRLEESKSRLLSYLPAADRQALTLAMLADLLDALSATPLLDRIAVTTPDEIVARVARSAGAEVLMRPEPGLNAALEDGIERLHLGRDEPVLIVLGDVPGALTSDFDQLLALERGAATPKNDAEVWLVPSADGGTSALLQRPGGCLPCCFGADSAKRHREAADRASIPFQEVRLASLAIDLDHPEDLDAFLATRGGGRRTRKLLEDRPGVRSTE